MNPKLDLPTLTDQNPQRCQNFRQGLNILEVSNNIIYINFYYEPHSMRFSKYTFPLVNSRSGVGVCLKKLVSRFCSVTKKRNQGRFPVTLGNTKTFTQPGSRLCMVTEIGCEARFPVRGHGWLRESVTQPGSRLRMVTLTRKKYV